MLNGVVKDTIVTAIKVGAPILIVVLVLGLIISIISLLIFIAYKLFIDKYLKQSETKSNKLIYNLSSKGDYYTLYISKLKHKRRD